MVIPITERRWPGHRWGILLGLMLLSSALPSLAQSPSARPVRVAGALEVADLPTLVAESKGLFARHGLNAEVTLGAHDAQRLARLRAGEVDFALMSLTALVRDLSADANPGGQEDPVILAGLIHSTDIDRVVFHRARAISEPSDLSGRQVALPPGNDAEFIWWQFSTFHDLAPDVGLLHQHSVEETVDLLAAGAIAAAVLREPWITRLRMRLDEALGQFPVSPFYTAKWVLVTSRRTAREQRDLCSAMLAAYRDAIESISQDRGGTGALYAERVGLSTAVLADDWRRWALEYHLSIDWSLFAALQQRADWAAADHAHAAPRIDITALIADSILRDLLPGAVGIPPLAPHRR